MSDETEWSDPEPLHSAAQDGDLPRVEQLVADGWDVNALDEWLKMTPLHYAAVGEHLAVASFLLANGADVNAYHEPTIGRTPLDYVVGKCSLEMARLLVAAGADPTIHIGMGLNALDKAKRRLRGDGPRIYALLSEVPNRRRPGSSR